MNYLSHWGWTNVAEVHNLKAFLLSRVAKILQRYIVLLVRVGPCPPSHKGKLAKIFEIEYLTSRPACIACTRDCGPVCAHQQPDRLVCENIRDRLRHRLWRHCGTVCGPVCGAACANDCGPVQNGTIAYARDCGTMANARDWGIGKECTQ